MIFDFLYPKDSFPGVSQTNFSFLYPRPGVFRPLLTFHTPKIPFPGYHRQILTSYTPAPGFFRCFLTFYTLKTSIYVSNKKSRHSETPMLHLQQPEIRPPSTSTIIPHSVSIYQRTYLYFSNYSTEHDHISFKILLIKLLYQACF